jgi:hypothetical protein
MDTDQTFVAKPEAEETTCEIWAQHDINLKIEYLSK